MYSAMQKVYFSKAFAEDGTRVIIILKAVAAHFFNTGYVGVGRSVADTYVIHPFEVDTRHDWPPIIY
ncbi:MAG: hypothetical protein ACLPN1_10185 [Dissulfurispiraceae bacterium]